MAIILVVSKIETTSIEAYQQDKPRKARCAGRDLDFGHSTQAPPPSPTTHTPTHRHTHTHTQSLPQPRKGYTQVKKDPQMAIIQQD